MNFFCNIHLAFIVLLLTSIASSLKYIEMEDFFPQINGDLSKITWAHAVNSVEKFNQAVKDNIMMLEADVLLGTLDGSTSEEIIPIMSHPPKKTSDLTLENFLVKVLEHKNIGIKLDFKSLEAVGPSLDILKSKEHMVNFPVWLNADILPGPVNNTDEPVNADVFLTKCKALFPQSTLSVGWKVKFGPNIPLGKYEQYHIDAMKETLARNGITQSVTFAVEAGMASRSLDTLPQILSIPNIKTTLTLWGGVNVIDFENLRNLIVTVGKHRIYIDLPQDIITKLNLSEISTKHSSSLSNSFMLGNLTILCSVFIVCVTVLLKLF